MKFFDPDTPVACCSLCGQALYRGERAWYANGVTACEDCFSSFARDLLKPYFFIVGEEDTL